MNRYIALAVMGFGFSGCVHASDALTKTSQDQEKIDVHDFIALNRQKREKALLDIGGSSPWTFVCVSPSQPSRPRTASTTALNIAPQTGFDAPVIRFSETSDTSSRPRSDSALSGISLLRQCSASQSQEATSPHAGINRSASNDSVAPTGVDDQEGHE